jgi:hypothetical protein
MLEIFEKQIMDIEAEIKILHEQLDYADSCNRPTHSIAKKIQEKQLDLESLKKFVSKKDAPRAC